MNLALAVLVIAAGACRIRVNYLVNAESMNIKKTTKPGLYERFTGRAEGAQCQSNLFCDRRESRGISGFDKENSG